MPSLGCNRSQSNCRWLVFFLRTYSDQEMGVFKIEACTLGLNPEILSQAGLLSKTLVLIARAAVSTASKAHLIDVLEINFPS